MKLILEEVIERIQFFIQNELLEEGMKLGPLDSLPELGLDSFSLIEILLFVERQFNTVVPIEELNYEKTETVRAIATEVIHYAQKDDE